MEMVVKASENQICCRMTVSRARTDGGFEDDGGFGQRRTWQCGAVNSDDLIAEGEGCLGIKDILGTNMQLIQSVGDVIPLKDRIKLP